MAAEARTMRRIPVFAMMSLVCLAVVVVNGAVVYTLMAPHVHEPAFERDTAGALQAIVLSSAGALAALMLFARGLDRRVNGIVLERSSTEEQLRQSQSLLAAAEEVAMVGSWEWDVRTNAVRWSDHQYRLFGFEPGSVPSSFDLYLSHCHPDERESIQQRVRMAVENRTKIEYDQRIIRADGAARIFRSHGELIYDAAGSPLRMVGTAQDVTEIREIEAARRRSDDEFRAFVETTREWVWAMGPDGKLTYCNPAVSDMLGYSPEELMAGDALALLHADDHSRVERDIATHIENRTGWTGWILRWRHRNGSYRHLESSAVPILNDGKWAGFRGADRDVTERVEAAKMKSDFVSFVSHQLRTPLAGIKWMLELAADADGIPHQPRTYVEEAQESAERLSELVNNLLDIARLESGRVELHQQDVDLASVTQSVVDEFAPVAAQKTLAVEVRLQPGCVVAGDQQMLRQVVMNLVSNAVKYTPSGGGIAITLESANDLVRWTIADTGVGIPKIAQTRLFEKFFRAENALTIETEGTGLGLHLVQLIVESSGGRIWCESEEGQGATFIITLPSKRE